MRTAKRFRARNCSKSTSQAVRWSVRVTSSGSAKRNRPWWAGQTGPRLSAPSAFGSGAFYCFTAHKFVEVALPAGSQFVLIDQGESALVEFLEKLLPVNR